MLRCPIDIFLLSLNILNLLPIFSFRGVSLTQLEKSDRPRVGLSLIFQKLTDLV